MNTPTRWLLATLTAVLWAFVMSASIHLGPDDVEAAVDVQADVDQAVADAKGDK